jgi:hypothetical protein
MDNKYVLMSGEEPTDAQLNTLMKEVAAEAVEKAAIAKKQLQERIAQEIEKAKSRYQATHTP